MRNMRLLRELWQYREMIISLVQRDLKSRYKGSVLGFLWMFLNPLLQLCIYTIVFGVIMTTDIDKFYLFPFVALVPWIFFSTCLSGGTTVIFGQQDMVKKIYFPREILPIAFTTSQFVNMVLSFLVIFVVVLLSGTAVNPRALLYLPLIMLCEYVLALGVTLLVSGMPVYFRDLQQIMGLVSLAWMYMTPVVYSVERVPEKYLSLYYLNPMTPIIISYRDVLYYGTIPNLRMLMGGTASWPDRFADRGTGVL